MNREVHIRFFEGSGVKFPRSTRRSAKQGLKEQARFYQIAHGSMNECQGVFRLQGLENQEIYNESKFLGWVIWKLIKSRE